MTTCFYGTLHCCVTQDRCGRRSALFSVCTLFFQCKDSLKASQCKGLILFHPTFSPPSVLFYNIHKTMKFCFSCERTSNCFIEENHCSPERNAMSSASRWSPCHSWGAEESCWSDHPPHSEYPPRCCPEGPGTADLLWSNVPTGGKHRDITHSRSGVCLITNAAHCLLFSLPRGTVLVK